MSRDIDRICRMGVTDIDSECEYNTVTFYKIDMRASRWYMRYTICRRPFSDRSMTLKSHRVFDIDLKADDLAPLELMYKSQVGGPFNNHGIKQIDDIGRY